MSKEIGRGQNLVLYPSDALVCKIYETLPDSACLYNLYSRWLRLYDVYVADSNKTLILEYLVQRCDIEASSVESNNLG